MATDNEKKQLSTVLKNMEYYARKNNCSFVRDDFASHTYVRFQEHDFTLSVLIWWYDNYLCIIDSEDEDAFCELSYKEFIKFQENFLERY